MQTRPVVDRERALHIGEHPVSERATACGPMAVSSTPNAAPPSQNTGLPGPTIASIRAATRSSSASATWWPSVTVGGLETVEVHEQAALPLARAARLDLATQTCPITKAAAPCSGV